MLRKLFTEDNKPARDFLILIFGIILIWTLYSLFGHQIIRSMYEGRSLGFLNKIIENKYLQPLQSYFAIADRLVLRFVSALFLIGLYLYLNSRIKSLLLNPLVFFAVVILFIAITYQSLVLEITPTSQNRISVAQHLIQGKGFYSSGFYDPLMQEEIIRSGRMAEPRKLYPYTYHPPLYPLLLALLMAILNISPLTAAAAINCFFFAALITSVYLILTQALANDLKVYAAISAIALTFFRPFNYVYSFVWTEIVYTALTVWAVFMLHKFYNCPQNREILILSLSATFTSLAFLCRYIGFTAVICGLIVITLKNKFSLSFKKIKQCLLFGSISLLPVIFWLIRNKILTGFFAGGHVVRVGQKTVSQVIFTAGKTLTKDFLFTDNKIILGFLLFCLVIFIIHKRDALLKQCRVLWERYPAFIILPLVYFISIIIIETSVHIDVLDTRLLMPMYPFILIDLFVLISGLFIKPIQRKD